MVYLWKALVNQPWNFLIHVAGGFGVQELVSHIPWISSNLIKVTLSFSLLFGYHVDQYVSGEDYKHMSWEEYNMGTGKEEGEIVDLIGDAIGIGIHLLVERSREKQIADNAGQEGLEAIERLRETIEGIETGELDAYHELTDTLSINIRILDRDSRKSLLIPAEFHP